MGTSESSARATFFRLWLAQVVSSLGDWIGFVAIVALAQRIGGSSPEAAIALVMSARLIPGFFFSQFAGVLVDRWNRKKVMVTCDIGRGLVLATLPFIHTVWGLVLASFLLEIGTLFWAPAKEASVPNLVPPDQLTTANSLSLVAAYGTFPIASFVFAVLTAVAGGLTEVPGLGFLDINRETLAISVDVHDVLPLGVDDRDAAPDEAEARCRARPARSASARWCKTSRRAGTSSSSTRRCAPSCSLSGRA